MNITEFSCASFPLQSQQHLVTKPLSDKALWRDQLPSSASLSTSSPLTYTEGVPPEPERPQPSRAQSLNIFSDKRSLWRIGVGTLQLFDSESGLTFKVSSCWEGFRWTVFGYKKRGHITRGYKVGGALLCRASGCWTLLTLSERPMVCWALENASQHSGCFLCGEKPSDRVKVEFWSFIQGLCTQIESLQIIPDQGPSVAK